MMAPTTVAGGKRKRVSEPSLPTQTTTLYSKRIRKSTKLRCDPVITHFRQIQRATHDSLKLAIRTSEALVRNRGIIDWTAVKPAEIGMPLWLPLKCLGGGGSSGGNGSNGSSVGWKHDAQKERDMTLHLAENDSMSISVEIDKKTNNGTTQQWWWWQGHARFNLPERSVALNDLLSHALRYAMSRETIQSAIRLFDRFMQVTAEFGSSSSSSSNTHGVRQTSRVRIACKEDLTLISTACLSLAVKMEEGHIPSPKDWVKVCNRVFSEQELMQTERIVLEHLHWDIRLPTPVAWLRVYLERLAGWCAQAPAVESLQPLPSHWSMGQIEHTIQTERRSTLLCVSTLLSVNTVTRMSQLLDLCLLHPLAPHCPAHHMAAAVLFAELHVEFHGLIRQMTGVTPNATTILVQIAEALQALQSTVPRISAAPPAPTSARGIQFAKMDIPVHEQWTRFQHPLHSNEGIAVQVEQLFGLNNYQTIDRTIHTTTTSNSQISLAPSSALVPPTLPLTSIHICSPTASPCSSQMSASSSPSTPNSRTSSPSDELMASTPSSPSPITTTTTSSTTTTTTSTIAIAATTATTSLQKSLKPFPHGPPPPPRLSMTTDHFADAAHSPSVLCSPLEATRIAKHLHTAIESTDLMCHEVLEDMF